MDDLWRELDRVAPDVPLLALGQTVFWDEPLKAGVALELQRHGPTRRFIAGVHDTDYFAKWPGPHGGKLGFAALPHNDTTTRGLWSAAGEFSALFGSETVVTKDRLLEHGVKLDRIERARPNALDELTEAYGWRGVVALAEDVPVTADLSIRRVFSTLRSTLDWALDLSRAAVCGTIKEASDDRADRLRQMLCDSLDRTEHGSLAEFYQDLLPEMYAFVAGERVDLETTRTSELLRFNSRTVGLPRFDLARLFVDPHTRAQAKEAYDAAIQGSEIYPVTRFGTGAIPFDLVIPGVGRGAIRIGRKAVVINTPEPTFISVKKPIESLEDLAAAVERKLGPHCALIGKAVTLVGMLAREFVFVFHEGASSYVRYSRELHRRLDFACHPILRVRYAAWDHIDAECAWLNLPKPLQRPFGADELCTPNFAARWRLVGQEQRRRLADLKGIRRPIDLIDYLEREIGGGWSAVAAEYRTLQSQIADVSQQISALQAERRGLYGRLKALKQRRLDAQAAMGQHFRNAIFEKQPTSEDMATRERLRAEVQNVIHDIAETRSEIRRLMQRQSEVAGGAAATAFHERRRTLEMDAELKRASLVREAVICTVGLESSAQRPAAWWFPIVSPSGAWFRRTVQSAEWYWEPLSA